MVGHPVLIDIGGAARVTNNEAEMVKRHTLLLVGQTQSHRSLSLGADGSDRHNFCDPGSRLRHVTSKLLTANAPALLGHGLWQLRQSISLLRLVQFIALGDPHDDWTRHTASLGRLNLELSRSTGSTWIRT